MRFGLFLLFYLFLPIPALADVFTVTSNADGGPGTLRNALENAANNGTGVTDFIVFSLPAGIAARTITLSGGTLQLSSDIVIDGTTQPGAAFGVTDARVHITSPGSCSSGFYMNTLSNVSIFGLWMSDFNGTGLSCFGGCISIVNCKNFTVGAPHKGNTFTNNFYSIASKGGFFITDSTPNENVVIQSNFFGLDTLGEDDERVNENLTMGVVKNLLIGGEGQLEGNFFGRGAITIGDTYNDPKYNNGYVKFLGNTIGINYKKTGYTIPANVTIRGRFDEGSDFDVTVKGNVFGVNEGGIDLWLESIYGDINVENNTFTQLVTNTTVGEAIILQSCKKKNVMLVHNNTISGMRYGIETGGTIGLTITNNSIFCTQKGIIINVRTPGIPIISIKQVLANGISGKTVPNGKVQLFYTDQCQELCENGQNLLASVTADNNGNFTYTGPVHGMISATVTDGFGTTSEFNGVKADVVSAYVKNATCGKNNGSITNIKIINASSWYWEDFAGNKMGSDTNLTKLAPGKYRIILREDNVNCDLISGYYEILAIAKPQVDSLFALSQPTCGQLTGVIHFTGPNVPNAYSSWRDSLNKGILYYNKDITNLAPGKYYYRMSLYEDSTCYNNTGPLVLTNQSGPALKISEVEITGATCGKSNGAIKNISYQNAVNPVYTVWEDSTGKVAGNGLDLLKVAGGKYRMKLKDGGACDTVATNYFVVPDVGTIDYDTSNMVVKAASCIAADGSVAGITSTSATTYTWVNAANENTVGNTQDIAGLPAGRYQLAFGNNIGCSAQTNVITIPQATFLSDTVKQEIVSDPNCDLDNGFVKPLIFTKDTALYSFEWRDDAGNILSNNTAVYNLKPGTYTLYATDTNGCRQAIFSTPVIQHGKPVFIYSAVQIINDTCNAGTGAIKNLVTGGINRVYDWQWFNAAQQPMAKTSHDLTGLIAGDYYAQITDPFNCSVNSSIFTVKNDLLAAVIPKADDQYIQRGTQALINITNLQQGTYNLYDTIAATIPIATSATGNFTTPPVRYDKQFYIEYVRNDCSSSRGQVWVKVFDSTRLAIPNAFSPNGDGINDTWKIKIQGVAASYKLAIFNRYGQNVFTAQDYNVAWNGTVNGKPLPVGTYYYIIQYTDNFNKPNFQKGFVAIIR